MIDGARIRRSLIVAALFSVAAAGTLLLLGHSAFAGGLLLGAILGAVPFASWASIAARGLASRRARLLALAFLAGKIALYVGVFLLLAVRPIVNAVAVMIGITLTSFVVVTGALLAPGAPRAKEAA